MGATTPGVEPPNGSSPPGARPYAWAGACFLILAVLFLVLIVLSTALDDVTTAVSPLTPLSGAGLVSLAGHATLARVTFGLGIVSDLVLIPGILGLYEALRRVERHAMLVAASFLAIYALMDLLVSGTTAVALVAVAQNYAGSPTGPGSPDFGVAFSLHAILDVSIPLSSAVMSVGILLVGRTVRGGQFGRALPPLSYAAAAAGFLYGVGAVVPGFNDFVGLSALLELIWFVVVGMRLLRLGAPVEPKPVGAPD